MSQDNKFFEDFSKLAGSAMNQAFSSIAELKVNFDAAISHRLDKILADKKLVSREEFEVVKKMAEEARKDCIKLNKIMEANKKGKK